jgi:hypothetical protein
MMILKGRLNGYYKTLSQTNNPVKRVKKRIDRSARSEFLNIPPAPLAGRPVIPT